jgi:hypothetical protein
MPRSHRTKQRNSAEAEPELAGDGNVYNAEAEVEEYSDDDVADIEEDEEDVEEEEDERDAAVRRAWGM